MVNRVRSGLRPAANYPHRPKATRRLRIAEYHRRQGRQPRAAHDHKSESEINDITRSRPTSGSRQKSHVVAYEVPRARIPYGRVLRTPPAQARRGTQSSRGSARRRSGLRELSRPASAQLHLLDPERATSPQQRSRLQVCTRIASKARRAFTRISAEIRHQNPLVITP